MQWTAVDWTDKSSVAHLKEHQILTERSVFSKRETNGQNKALRERKSFSFKAHNCTGWSSWVRCLHLTRDCTILAQKPGPSILPRRTVPRGWAWNTALFQVSSNLLFHKGFQFQQMKGGRRQVDKTKHNLSTKQGREARGRKKRGRRRGEEVRQKWVGGVRYVCEKRAAWKYWHHPTDLPAPSGRTKAFY